MARAAHTDAARPARADAWYRQPILWLGAAILAASLAGCIWLIVVATQYADEPVGGAGDALLGVPVAAPTAPAAPE